MYKFIFFLLILSFSCQETTKNSSKKNLSPEELELEQLSLSIIDSPKNSSLYLKRGMIFWSKKQNEKALNDFYKMVAYDSSKPQYFEVLAEFFVDNLNIERGISALDKAIKLDPYNPKYHVLQGKYCLYIKKYQPAIDHLNNALKRDKFNPEAYLYKGLVFRELKNSDKAISSLLTASEQDPTWDAPFEILGEIYAEKKNDLCLKYFDNAARANLKNTTALSQKAYYLKSNGKINEASAIYESQVLASPQNVDAIYNLGVISYDLKDYTKAEKQFNICLQVDPANASAFYMLGKTSLKLNNKSKAKEYFENSLNFDSTFTEAKQELKKLN